MAHTQLYVYNNMFSFTSFREVYLGKPANAFAQNALSWQSVIFALKDVRSGEEDSSNAYFTFQHKDIFLSPFRVRMARD